MPGHVDDHPNRGAEKEQADDSREDQVPGTLSRHGRAPICRYGLGLGGEQRGDGKCYESGDRGATKFDHGDSLVWLHKEDVRDRREVARAA